jgi:hypothetical protein
MPFIRNCPRTTDTHDLSVSVLATRSRPAKRRVLNLSARGMLISAADLEVGQVTRFELEGRRFRAEGVAEVAHRSSRTTGLRFVSLDVTREPGLSALVARRVTRGQMAEAARTPPGAYLG